MAELRRFGPPFLCVAAAVFGLISSALCIVSEFKRTKDEELKVDGGLCYLPESCAYRYGIGALVLLCGAQIIGNFGIGWACWSRKRKKKKMTRSRLENDCDKRRGIVTTCLMVVSWISFVIAVTLLGTATSMNREQPYEKGWLNGECYTVKDGVFIGSAVLAFIATSFSILCFRLQGNKYSDQDDIKERRASER